MESQQKDMELIRLQEQLANEGVLNNVLRDLLLQPSSSLSVSASEADSSLKQSPSRNLDDVDYHGSGENSSNTTGHETPVRDLRNWTMPPGILFRSRIKLTTKLLILILK